MVSRRSSQQEFMVPLSRVLQRFAAQRCLSSPSRVLQRFAAQRCSSSPSRVLQRFCATVFVFFFKTPLEVSDLESESHLILPMTSESSALRRHGIHS